MAIYIPKEVHQYLKEGVIYSFKVLLEPEKEVIINSNEVGLDIHINPKISV